jgi:hypothetical protein
MKKVFNNLENSEEQILLFLRRMLVCLECIRQFKEYILMCVSIEHGSNQADFLLAWPAHVRPAPFVACLCLLYIFFGLACLPVIFSGLPGLPV